MRDRESWKLGTIRVLAIVGGWLVLLGVLGLGSWLESCVGVRP